jgi:hypothetical protein
VENEHIVTIATSLKHRSEMMSDFDSSKMDEAANNASSELETIREKHPDGVKAVEDWVRRWVSSAGYKRLGRILADRWD